MTDAKAVVEAVADRLRVLLRTRLVCIMLRQGGSFALHAVAAESAQLAASARAKHDRKGLQFAADLASRAVGAGEPVAVPIDPATHALGSLVPAGMLIAAPFRTSQTEGAVLVYPRQDGAFSPEEKSVISAVAGFGSVAIANAELYSSSRAHTHELHQLLDVSSELGSIGQLDDFLQKFALRAADFLGFGRAFIGLLEEGAFRVRWSAESGATRRVERVFPEGPASRALMNREVFWTDDPNALPGSNLDVIAEFNVRQILAVPLLGTDGQVLGMFGVLDRLDGSQISHEDIRRARALAAQVAVALEASRNLDRSERHRTRAESLMSLALELNSLLKLPDFAQSFARRAADMLGAQTAALAVKQESGLETLVLAQGIEADQHRPLFRRFSHALQAALDKHAEPIVSSTSTEILGAALGAELGGGDCTLVRLMGGSAELVGVLCLANRGKPLAAEDQQLLQAIAGHASVALENARLFTRMEQANRHWIEIFDAIGDFIVAHDESDNVLRVNRSLADFIGVQRQELIGLNMSALLAMGQAPPTPVCPFCRSTGESEGEFVHPVLERTYLVSTSRAHGATSEGMQTIHVLKDISDRREAERRYRELFDNIQEGLFFSTPDGRFIEVNDAQSLILVADTAGLVSYANRRWFDMGYEQRQLVGRPLEELVAPMRRPALSEAISATIAGRQVDNLDMQILRGDGRIGQFSMNLSPMRDEQGNVNSLVVVMSDVTDAATLQAKLMHAEKMAAVGQLVSGVAHEVNNPLPAILGFADLLMENPDLPESARKDLRVILQEAQRTKQIVQNLLSFARQMPPQRNALQLNSILRRTIQLRSYDFNSHGIDVIEHLDESLPEIIGDAHQLQQVFLNILNNAYDAVHEVRRPARIEITSIGREDFVEVTFSDNGKGITHSDKIFDPFFTTKEVGTGTGLSLSICYGIVKDHGGEIPCHNNIAGQGATFMVRLPAASHTASLGVAAGVTQP